MRITLFLLFWGSIAALFLLITLSGALLWLGLMLYGLFIILTLAYSDICILFFLGAREVNSSDDLKLCDAAAQAAYKLALPVPKLYFYNGSMDRAFALQHGSRVGLVLNKNLMVNYQATELAAICFELLLQVKKGMASKRTKVMYLLGLISWCTHALIKLVTLLLPFKEMKQAGNWVLNYFLHPWLDFLFSLTLGRGYFKKLLKLIAEYPREHETLNKVGLKLRQPSELYSLPTRKMMQISSASRSSHFQNILTLEFLPHEWDFIFAQEDIEGVKQA
jgi:hypothetical protein